MVLVTFSGNVFWPILYSLNDEYIHQVYIDQVMVAAGIFA